MKRYIFIISFVIAMCACSKYDEVGPIAEVSDYSTKAKFEDNYQLNIQDLHAFINYLSKHEHYKGNTIQSWQAINHNGKTVFYAINFEHGWLVISSDKRGPIVLAKNEEGSFETEYKHDEVQSWFETMADQIVQRIEDPDSYYTNLSKVNIRNENLCLDFWRAINADQSFLKQVVSKESNKLELLSLSQVRDIPVTYESVDHIIDVYWSQREPFNLYCPLIAADSTRRCPAGCAPVAVAQTAYYLHSKINHPSSSPTWGNCSGWYGNYTQSFANFSSDTWSDMSESSDPSGYAALLIGYLGKEMQVNYTDTLTTTTFAKMHSIFGSHFGINYQTGNYDMDVVYSNLRSRLPVICAAYKLTSQGYVRHAFIIDGYESCIFMSRFEYADSTGNTKLVVTLSEPEMTDVRINWGLGTIGRNTYYAVTGTWMGFDNNKEIVYNFMSENK